MSIYAESHSSARHWDDPSLSDDVITSRPSASLMTLPLSERLIDYLWLISDGFLTSSKLKQHAVKVADSLCVQSRWSTIVRRPTVTIVLDQFQITVNTWNAWPRHDWCKQTWPPAAAPIASFEPVSRSSQYCWPFIHYQFLSHAFESNVFINLPEFKLHLWPSLRPIGAGHTLGPPPFFFSTWFVFQLLLSLSLHLSLSLSSTSKRTGQPTPTAEEVQGEEEEEEGRKKGEVE